MNADVGTGTKASRCGETYEGRCGDSRPRLSGRAKLGQAFAANSPGPTHSHSPC